MAHKHTIAIFLSLVVSVVAALVMLGWFLDITALKSIYPGWVTMKFSTAMSFLLSGALVYCVGRIARGDRAWTEVLLPGLVLMILLPMVALLAATASGTYIYVAEMFVQESSDAILSVEPGRPSVGTMICFTLVAVVGLASIFEPDGKPRLWRIAGGALAVLGAVALLGYVLDESALYYYREGFSTAMAVHTALLFVLLGMALWLDAVAISNVHQGARA
jgi:hypothetical protein